MYNVYTKTPSPLAHKAGNHLGSKLNPRPNSRTYRNCKLSSSAAIFTCQGGRCLALFDTSRRFLLDHRQHLSASTKNEHPSPFSTHAQQRVGSFVWPPKSLPRHRAHLPRHGGRRLTPPVHQGLRPVAMAIRGWSSHGQLHGTGRSTEGSHVPRKP